MLRISDHSIVEPVNQNVYEELKTGSLGLCERKCPWEKPFVLHGRQEGIAANFNHRYEVSL